MNKVEKYITYDNTTKETDTSMWKMLKVKSYIKCVYSPAGNISCTQTYIIVTAVNGWKYLSCEWEGLQNKTALKKTVLL